MNWGGFSGMKYVRFLFSLVLIIWVAGAMAGIEYPDAVRPGEAQVRLEGDKGILENNVLMMEVSLAEGKVKPVKFVNKHCGAEMDGIGGEFFTVMPGDGRELKCSALSLRTSFAEENNLSAVWADEETGCVFEGKLVLENGANYVREVLTVTAGEKAVVIKSVSFSPFSNKNAKTVGSVSGSPVVGGDCFFGYEHPNSSNKVTDEGQIKCSLERNTRLEAGESLTQSMVMGVVPSGQLRRGFLYYIERARVKPYRQFLHYNSWYDIAWGGREKMNAKECVEVIEGFGRELTEKRGVRLNSFVFDDGWDDPKTLWRILEKNFPEGFGPLQKAAGKYKSRLGVWLSPWGGYGHTKQARLDYGKTQGFETNPAGFSLAGKKYFERFFESCSYFVDEYDVNFFKFDGTDARYLEQTEALFKLTCGLYGKDEDMFISLTTGTWASPFWLLHGDSVWRGGHDMSFTGKGSRRRQWITYRDMQTYNGIVKAGPLYPVSSIMNQGIAHAKWGTAKLEANAEEFAEEVYSFFGMGTNLQELYISYDLMTDEMWDVLAEGAKWSRANKDVLADTHWIGGDPGKLEVYGFASWQDDKGILMLRNPNDEAQSITIDIGKAFELPSGAGKEYSMRNVFDKSKANVKLKLKAGVDHKFELEPFEVMVLEGRAEATK